MIVSNSFRRSKQSEEQFCMDEINFRKVGGMAEDVGVK
jgi:hypothetical protein